MVHVPQAKVQKQKGVGMVADALIALKTNVPLSKSYWPYTNLDRPNLSLKIIGLRAEKKAIDSYA